MTGSRRNPTRFHAAARAGSSAPVAGRCLTNLPFANTLTGRTLAGRTLAGRTLASHPCIHKPQYAISLPRRCPFVNAPAKGEKFCYKAGENRFICQHIRRRLLQTAVKNPFSHKDFQGAFAPSPLCSAFLAARKKTAAVPLSFRGYFLFLHGRRREDRKSDNSAPRRNSLKCSCHIL